MQNAPHRVNTKEITYTAGTRNAVLSERWPDTPCNGGRQERMRSAPVIRILDVRLASLRQITPARLRMLHVVARPAISADDRDVAPRVRHAIAPGTPVHYVSRQHRCCRCKPRSGGASMPGPKSLPVCHRPGTEPDPHMANFGSRAGRPRGRRQGTATRQRRQSRTVASFPQVPDAGQSRTSDQDCGPPSSRTRPVK
jgi:hypothetical protein